MKRCRHRLADTVLRRTRLCYGPVRVKSGVAAGARWTLYPQSADWRGGVEGERQRELIGLGDIPGWCGWDWGGAHDGLYRIGLARRTGPTGQVVSFEPNPLSFARVEPHRRMNALTWLKPGAAAGSDTSGTAKSSTYANGKARRPTSPTRARPAAPTGPR